MHKLGLLQVHELRNFGPSCLNRDGDNQAKVGYFGGCLRGRVSSQCKKRVMRKYFWEDSKNHGIDIPNIVVPYNLNESYNTREVGEFVFKFLEDSGISYNLSDKDIKGLKGKQWFGSLKGSKNKGDKTTEDEGKEDEVKKGEDTQNTVMLKWSWHDVKTIIQCTLDKLQNTSVYLDNLSLKARVQIISSNDKAKGDLKKYNNDTDKEKYISEHHDLLVACFNKLTLKDQLAYTSECREVGFDIALFGRMSTINILTNVEAALSVSHALSTNKVQQEDDFFIALDDFLESGIIKDDKGDTKKGAGHMSETSYDSCCYYTYYSIDLDLLVHNLKNYNTDGDKCLAIFKDDLRLLLKAIFETTPTGKSKGFASIGVKPSYMIFERISDKRPVNYINAFEKPVTCSADKGLVECSIERLNTFVDDMDGYAGFKGDRVTCSPGLIGEGKISAIKTSTTYANVDEAIESILATIK